jgi:hypothetical protein
MKMNNKMLALLRMAGIETPIDGHGWADLPSAPALTVADGSVLLKAEYEQSAHVNRASFPDQTGFECFINHVHFAFTNTRKSLLSSLAYTWALQRELINIRSDKRFQVILSISEEDQTATVRFHQLRPGEAWISDDLEKYASEAILILPANANQTEEDGARRLHT